MQSGLGSEISNGYSMVWQDSNVVFSSCLQRTVNGKKAQKQRCDTAIPTKKANIFSAMMAYPTKAFSGHCCDLGQSKLSEIVNMNHYYGKAENINMLL